MPATTPREKRSQYQIYNLTSNVSCVGVGGVGLVLLTFFTGAARTALDAGFLNPLCDPWDFSLAIIHACGKLE